MAYDLHDDDEDDDDRPYLENTLLRNRHLRRVAFDTQRWRANVRYTHLLGKRHQLRTIDRCMPRS